MEPLRHVARRLACAAPVATIALVLLAAVPASAGGWATITVDEMPTAVAGMESRVELTMRAHGVRLMDPLARDGVTDLELVVTAPDGTTTASPITTTAEQGHLEALVRFDQPGTHEWRVDGTGWPSKDLGVLEVVAQNQGAAGDATGSSLVPLLALGAAAALGGVALIDLVVGRRRVALA